MANSPAAVRGMYRSLIRTVQSFPREAVLETRTDDEAMKFAEAAKIQIRAGFKEGMSADSVSSGKLFANAQKELGALRSLLQNDCMKRHPGPGKEESLHKSPANANGAFFSQ
mmetsp:Transcript_28460/g.55490  ORF Transcript_28460/g.55490 Transcript_28460/m.55490 type:complete len:112 (-) Transcript_28460:238-573(-)